MLRNMSRKRLSLFKYWQLAVWEWTTIRIFCRATDLCFSELLRRWTFTISQFINSANYITIIISKMFLIHLYKSRWKYHWNSQMLHHSFFRCLKAAYVGWTCVWSSRSQFVMCNYHLVSESISCQLDYQLHICIDWDKTHVWKKIKFVGIVTCSIRLCLKKIFLSTHETHLPLFYMFSISTM